MPNRILKESITVSDTVDKLSWFEEVFFYRLIVSCDDYGRMDARPPVLRARLFPLKDLDYETIERALHALKKAGLLRLYTVDERPYLELCSWDEHQKMRTKREKFPPSPQKKRELIGQLGIDLVELRAGVADLLGERVDLPLHALAFPGLRIGRLLQLVEREGRVIGRLIVCPSGRRSDRERDWEREQRSERERDCQHGCAGVLHARAARSRTEPRSAGGASAAPTMCGCPIP